MSKLDWDKANQHIPDPATILRDQRDTELSNTATARKEGKLRAKARSKAAKQAAKTRKTNRERQAASDAAASLQARASEIAEKIFWADLKRRMAAANAQRTAAKKS